MNLKLLKIQTKNIPACTSGHSIVHTSFAEKITFFVAYVKKTYILICTRVADVIIETSIETYVPSSFFVAYVKKTSILTLHYTTTW